MVWFNRHTWVEFNPTPRKSVNVNPWMDSEFPASYPWQVRPVPRKYKERDGVWSSGASQKGFHGRESMELGNFSCEERFLSFLFCIITRLWYWNVALSNFPTQGNEKV